MLNLQIKIFGLIGVFLILGIASGANAQTTLSNITFPIQELQGCASLDACRVFCDDFKNASACLSFAEKKGLIKKKDVQRALKFIQLVVTGDAPVSGCSDQYECLNQCALPENQSQCFRWAKDNGLVTNISNGDEPSVPQDNNTDQIEAPSTENTDQIISPDESNTPEPEISVTASPKITTAPKKKVFIDTKTTETPKPSDTENQDQDQNLDQNLQDSTNTQDTTSDQISPAVDRGNDHYKQRIKEILARENGPGGCKTFDECGAFCSQPQHSTACLDFARKHGLMSDQDIQKAEQLVNRPGPGGCIGQQCQTYCSDVNHQEACLKFALDNHFVSQTEADNIRNSQKLQRGLRTFGGPGGCANEEQCRTYCSQASHVEECLSFGQKTGVFNQQEVQQHKQEFQNQLEQSPPPQDQSNTDTQTQDKDQSGQPNVQPTESQDNQDTTESPAVEPSKSPSVTPSGSSPQTSPLYTPYPSPSNSPYPSSSPYPSNTVSPSTACSQYGGTWNGTTCISPSQSPTPSPSTSVANTPSSCPSGQYYDTARQVCGTPADNCTTHGGTWNGTTCIMPSSTPSQTVSPSPSNSPTPYPSSSVSPSTACSQYGGTWNGTTCVMPSHNYLISSILKFFEGFLR